MRKKLIQELAMDWGRGKKKELAMILIQAILY